MHAVPDVLRNAAGIIDQRGWNTTRDVDPDTGQGVCANGAIRLAVGHKIRASQNVHGTSVFDMVAPIEMGADELMSSGRALTATLRVLDEYMHKYGLDTFKNADDTLPTVIRYNDCFAKSPDDVTKVMRDCADWIESAPLGVLEQITRQAPDGYPSPATKPLHAVANSELVSV